MQTNSEKFTIWKRQFEDEISTYLNTVCEKLRLTMSISCNGKYNIDIQVFGVKDKLDYLLKTVKDHKVCTYLTMENIDSQISPYMAMTLHFKEKTEKELKAKLTLLKILI